MRRLAELDHRRTDLDSAAWREVGATDVQVDVDLVPREGPALSVPGDLSKIGGRDFLHCTNLMELTAQGFTRTVSITLATKMQSQIPENISDYEIEKRVLQESILKAESRTISLSSRSGAA